MRRGSKVARWLLLLVAASLALVAGPIQAQEPEPDLRTLVDIQRRQLELQQKALDEQSRQIEELRRRMDAGPRQGGQEEQQPGMSGAPPAPGIDDSAIKKIVADYLQKNPGAGMPPGVQTGYTVAPLTPLIGPGGFVIRSTPNPVYANWNDESRIPFELRIRGRLMLAYTYYHAQDDNNHLTSTFATQNANSVRFADNGSLNAKRVNLIAEGTAFDPDLRYRINFNGFSRGIAAFQNNKVNATAPAGGTAPNTSGVSTIGGGALVSHGVTLFEAFVAYDFRPCCFSKGCGADCPEGTSKYAPTFTAVVGKMKPFFGLEEFMGNQNLQFCEFSMADLFFSSDDDARLMAAGFEVRAIENRLFVMSIATNGSESFTPNQRLDNYPGFITGVWYDIGGTWNEQRKAWNLFGDSIADINYSCDPVARVGGSLNLVPMNRRSLYGDAEQARYFVAPGAPGGSSIINVLNGGVNSLPAGSHAVDKFDAYSYNVFGAGKYKGFSIFNEWWLRDLNNFRSTPNGLGNIIYQANIGPNRSAVNALFPSNRGLIDYGTNVSAGYFLIPRKLEVAARWAYIRGQSGSINGTGVSQTVTVPGVGAVRVIDGAFRKYGESNEYTVGVNWYVKGNAWKWQTDFSIYDGGNPAGGGQSIAGFIAGVDGWMVRSQVQLAF